MYYLRYVVLRMAQERTHKNQNDLGIAEAGTSQEYSWNAWISSLLAAGIQVTSVEGAGQDKASLWITDDESFAKECVTCERPVLGVLTENNAGQGFEGVSYLVSDLTDVESQYLEKVYRRQAEIPWDILETERCLLRETTEQDAEAFYEIYADPSVTEHMEDLPKDRDAFTAWLQDYAKSVYEFFGYGIWTVCLKQESLGKDTAEEKSGDARVGSEKSGDACAESEKSGDACAESEKSGDACAESEKSGDARVGSEKSGDACAESEKSGDACAESEKSDDASMSGTKSLAVIGRAGLTVREGYDAPELGFVIGKSWQGQGLAYEICSAILEYAREQGIPEVIAFAEPENEASLKLLQKLGFHKTGLWETYWQYSISLT